MEGMNTEKIHQVENVTITDEYLSAKVDGQEYTFPLKRISKRLSDATNQERQVFQISPSGYGIHWPLIDEDLSINGLLGISMSPSDRLLRRT